MSDPNVDRQGGPAAYIGCCGAYCKTCRALGDGSCKGCKLGYGEGGRDINKAKCNIKICCFKEKRYETCADCPDFPKCDIINGFYSKNGFKYKKYKQAIEFIIKNGYSDFIRLANNWRGPYGKYL
ncbi:MAG TPA: DUF3795 domain-containing protein [Candidatus Methanofastidiosa archaeon]|nr:DUF3795 domain-containing protein [Candidatus Methanofastidiosa archaeon]